MLAADVAEAAALVVVVVLVVVRWQEVELSLAFRGQKTTNLSNIIFMQ